MGVKQLGSQEGMCGYRKHQAFDKQDFFKIYVYGSNIWLPVARATTDLAFVAIGMTSVSNFTPWADSSQRQLRDKKQKKESKCSPFFWEARDTNKS